MYQITGIAVLILFFSPSSFGEGKFSVSAANKKERFERDVDRAALASQNVAIQKLDRLAKKYRNTGQESVLLARLAETYQQSASIHFRLAHASAHSKRKPINLRKFRNQMTKSIQTLDRLISRYPRFPELPRMYFLRGKAHEELEHKAHAQRDYQHLVRTYPNVPEAIPSYMSLAQFAIDANQHEVAVRYLHPVEQLPHTPHYPFAIYKLAWSYYNLENTAKALGYLETHIKYYQSLAKNPEDLSPSDLAILETSLKDTTLFYLQGYERKEARYSLDNAYPYFKDLAWNQHRGKMFLRFSKLLRAHGHNSDLVRWKNMMIESEEERPETVDITIVVFAHELQRHQYERIQPAAKDLVKLYHINRKAIRKSETYNRIQSLLLETAKTLQTLTIKNKKATRVRFLSTTLASVYDAFTKIVDKTDPRIPGVHYNLAETLFEIKDYAGATKHYRWVVRNWKGKKSRIKVRDASLKAIASRYEILRSKNMVPTNLNPKTLKDNESGKIHPLLIQWVRWIDRHNESYRKKDVAFENFQFEANRALYHQNKIRLALKRLLSFSEKHPSSKYAIPSASLVLDTYIKSESWSRTHAIATDLLRTKIWKKKPFGKKLYRIAADAYFKQVQGFYAQKNYEETLDRSEEFLKRYSKSERSEDVLFLAGNAALDLDRLSEAETHFTQLIKKHPNSENAGPALLKKTSLEEKRYDFKKASEGYLTYLGLPTTQKALKPNEAADLKKKILFLKWQHGDLADLRRVLHSEFNQKKFCSSDLDEECDFYRAMSRVPSPNPKESKEAFRFAMKGHKKNRPIWAAAALENQDDYAFPDRLLMIRIISARWDDLDPIARFSLIPKLSQSIPRAFELNRYRVMQFSKLKPNARSIKRRVKLIKEMEEVAAKVMKLPWSRIRAAVMNEIAQLYVDFSTGLQNIPPPKGLKGEELQIYQETITKLTLPFEEKSQEIRNKAFEIASKFSVEDKVYDSIVTPFFRDNPSLANTLKGKVVYKERSLFRLESLDNLYPEGDWEDLIDDEPSYADHPNDYLRWLWARAIQSKNWPQVAHLISESKKRIKEPVPVGLMRTLSLVAAGAQGEGLAELNALRDELKGKARSRATVILISHTLRSLNKELTKDLIEELEDEADGKEILDFLSNEEEAFVVVYGAAWSGADLPDRDREDLLEEATDSSIKAQVLWAREELNLIKKEKRGLASG